MVAEKIKTALFLSVILLLSACNGEHSVQTPTDSNPWLSPAVVPSTPAPVPPPTPQPSDPTPSPIGLWDFGTLTDGTQTTYTYEIQITSSEVINNFTCTEGHQVAHAQAISTAQVSNTQVVILENKSVTNIENGVECTANIAPATLKVQFSKSNVMTVDDGTYSKDVYRLQ